jgi:hypothetical protein
MWVLWLSPFDSLPKNIFSLPLLTLFLISSPNFLAKA